MSSSMLHRSRFVVKNIRIIIEIAHLSGFVCSRPIIDAHFSSRERPLSALYRSLFPSTVSILCSLLFTFCRESKETPNRFFIFLCDDIPFIIEVRFPFPPPLSLSLSFSSASGSSNQMRSADDKPRISPLAVDLYRNFLSEFVLALARDLRRGQTATVVSP